MLNFFHVIQEAETFLDSADKDLWLTEMELQDTLMALLFTPTVLFITLTEELNATTATLITTEEIIIINAAMGVVCLPARQRRNMVAMQEITQKTKRIATIVATEIGMTTMMIITDRLEGILNNTLNHIPKTHAMVKNILQEKTGSYNLSGEKHKEPRQCYRGFCF
jgi:hypothetical protein